MSPFHFIVGFIVANYCAGLSSTGLVSSGSLSVKYINIAYLAVAGEAVSTKSFKPGAHQIPCIEQCVPNQTLISYIFIGR